ncbi:quinoprotein dehydrogenase-associated putative ABC transporter substrate-binding protein [Caulobacter sp. 17J80-11]|nr:quinoprotein dehydrogenase-associated putative ABC transporter substrate-binding protein [Caulobacter sp. 17J80-11]
MRSALIAAALLAIPAPVQAGTPAQAPRVLRVCADPNNLPFSNDKGEGFENRIIELVAQELHAEVRYVWWAQRRGFLRNTLNAGDCDLVPGVASSLEMLATTRPYYRSSYMFVTRQDRGLAIESLDDPRLKTLTVGVQMIGDDGANTPPAHALARRGATENVRGYMVYGDYAEPSPAERIVEAVEHGDVDVAVVWGPLAGWSAARQPEPLTLTPVTPWLDGPSLPMVFDVSMGVRKTDRALLREIEAVLAARKSDVDAILANYHVPLD